MLFVLIILWGITSLLLILDAKNTTSLWLSGFVFCGGAGALAVVLGQQFMPYMLEQYPTSAWNEILSHIRISASLTCYYGLPYTFIMFGLQYRRLAMTKVWRTAIPFLLIIPALASLWFTPEYTENNPVHFHVIVWWVVPYMIVGTVLIIGRKEWSSIARRIHWMTSLAVVPAALFVTVMNYVLPSMGYTQMWKYNTVIVALAFIIFLITLFNYGFLGIRVFIQKRQLDSTLRAITSGTTILNNGIKNDVGKMLLFCEKISEYAIGTEQKELAEDIEVIKASANHVREMIRRVHEQTQDLMLHVEEVELGSVVDQALKGLNPRISEQGLTIEKSYQPITLLQGDPVQLGEAITNVVVNAIDAMPTGGLLKVDIKQAKKHLELHISDTGMGIASKELAHVMEPFYTTKASRNSNYGLGLAYSYQVIKKHNGTLDILSKAGQGTTVIFRLPRIARTV
jgi:anti-sigma regulatory factor (Ser/Thr protein kinase)